MQKNEEFHRVLLEGIREAIFILDGRGTFHFMNTSAADQVGGRPEEFVGKSVRDIFPAELADGFVASVQKVIETRAGMTVVTQQPLREGLRWHRTQLEPLNDADGQITTVLLIAKDITDWKNAEEARTETEVKYRTLVEQIPAITYKAPLDQTSGVLFISPQVTEVLGFTLEECQNDPDLWRRQLHPDDRDRVLRELAQSRQVARRFASEYRILAKDGRVKWFRDEARFVLAPDGHPLYQQGVMLDITEQKAAQDTARRNDELFHQLFACSPVGMALHDSRGRLVNANRAARDILGLPEVRQNVEFELLSDPQLPAEVRTRLLAGESVRFEAIYDFDRVRRERLHDTSRTGIAHLDTLMTPLTEEDTGKRTGYLVQLQDITEKKSAQKAARQSDELFRRVFVSSPIGMTLFDSRGKFVDANRAAREIFGVRENRQDLGYSLLSDPMFPADNLARLRDGDSVRFESVYDFDRVRREQIHDTCRTGIAHLDLSVSPLNDGHTGERIGYLAQSQDITERKRAESEIATLATQRQLALDAAGLGYCHYDPLARTMTWDDRFAAIFELTGHGGSDYTELLKRLDPNDMRKFQALNVAALDATNPRPYEIQFHVDLPGGTERWVETHAAGIFEGSGDTRRSRGVFGAARDITNRKRIENALRESRQEFENLLQSLEDGVWAAMPDGRYLYLNPAMETIYGQTREKLFANPGLWLEVVHPEDQLRARESGAEILRSGRADIEYRILRPDGGVRWIRDRKSVVRDAEGRSVRIGGIIRDVTNRIEANQKAEQYRANLKSLATALTLTEERERRRLAANIHDDLVQILGLIQIKLADLKTSLRGPNKTALHEIEGLVNRSVQTSRSLTLQLSPPVLYDLGFTAAAEWLAEDMKALYGISISVVEYGRGPHLDEPRRVVLFQCLREALVNAAKHARAPNVRVRIRRGTDAVRVAVRDRGVGFEPSEVSRRPSQHFGLFSIRERLEPMGGRFVVRSAPGRGTTVFMTVPCPNTVTPLTEPTL